MESGWPKEELDLANHQLIQLDSSVQGYYNIKREQGIKLIQKYENVYHGSIGQSCFLECTSTLH